MIWIKDINIARVPLTHGDKITGKNTYVERITIDKAVSDVVAPIFSHKDLASEALLPKCLHGETQNVNVWLNNLIWTRCPKRIYVGNSVLKTAVASAVICYNDGGSRDTSSIGKIRDRAWFLHSRCMSKS